MKNFMPMLFSDLKSYNGSKLIKDIVAGIIVAIIALPLSIALALASGVTPEKGIYTAIVAGFLISAVAAVNFMDNCCNIKVFGNFFCVVG